jgi:hypothetical protein
MRQMCNQDDIATNHTQWIYVSQNIHTPSQPGRKDKIQGLQSCHPTYDSNHVITRAEVEHGRNHLITGH